MSIKDYLLTPKQAHKFKCRAERYAKRNGRELALATGALVELHGMTFKPARAKGKP